MQHTRPRAACIIGGDLIPRPTRSSAASTAPSSTDVEVKLIVAPGAWSFVRGSAWHSEVPMHPPFQPQPPRTEQQWLFADGAIVIPVSECN